jgi:uncharacterized protein YgiM (DUF1202 family)
LIDVFLAPNLFDTGANTTVTEAAVTPEPTAAGGTTEEETPAAETPTSESGFVEGDVVFATVDVNLRAEPSEDAEVLAIIGEGAELTVLGPAEGVWLPVQDAAGNIGYVNSEFISQ